MAASEARKTKKRKHGKAFSKKQDHEEDEENDLRLEDVIGLGGTKEDYQMLKDLQKSVADKENNDAMDNDLNTEIKDLVQALGLEDVVLENDTTEVEVEDQNSNLEREHVRSSEDVTDEVSPQSKPLKEEKIFIPKFEKMKKMVIKDDSFWHDQLLAVSDITETISVDHGVASKIREVARQFWENEVELYQERKLTEKSSDANWLRTVLSSGTLSDRVAANTMLLQESPVHQMKRLESLLSMAKKKNRREAIMALDSLRNLWTSTLLPERKLKHFWQWPLSQLNNLGKEFGKNGEASLLILWYFEDQLKEKCAEFVDVLQNMSRDTIPGIRDKTIGAMYELLVAKPEQEQKLLTAISNKLGDPNRKVASRASYLLGQLVIKHPNMKMIVIQEVERMIYRPNISTKAQYYAICFLNQMILTKNESLVASKLISIYFTFFKTYAKKDSSSFESKMLSALLSGVNRAFPYTQDNEEKYEEQLNMLFKICHSSSFHTSVQALMLLFQVMESRKTVTDRYYRALYEKLFDAGINTTRKRTMFLNVIYKSMRSDPAINRVKAFFKRLLQIGSCEEPNFVCGLLYLLSEVLNLKPGIKGFVMQPEDCDDDDEHFEDIKEDTFTAPNENEKFNEKIIDEIEDRTADVNSNGRQKAGWTFRDQELKRAGYDINARNPLFCGAQFSSAWEVHPLLKHYHPSVNRFAESILHDKTIEYKGDPLQDFTLIRFLDRFMYKNPKKKAKDHGSSIMQRRTLSERSMEMPVNSKNFTEMKIEKIREDEIFFYRYFKRKAEIDEAKKGNKKKQELIDNFDAEGTDDIDTEDFDFASEISKSKETEPKRKNKRKKDEDDSDFNDDRDSDDEEDDEEGDFDLDDLEFSEDEEFAEDFEDEGEPRRKKNFSDADYEKVLLENLTDSDINEDGDSDEDHGVGSGRKEGTKHSGNSVSSMFAAADEVLRPGVIPKDNRVESAFAHLLEGSEKSKGQKNQERWESRDRSGMRKQKRKPPKESRTIRTGRNVKSHQRKGSKRAKFRDKGYHKSKSNRKRKNF